MKFHLQAPTTNVVTAPVPDGCAWDRSSIAHNLVLLPDAVIEGWAPDGFAALDGARLRRRCSRTTRNSCCSAPARGSGFRIRGCLQALSAAHVGVEVMDTRAACRTFNILVAEDRRVAAALVLA